MKTTKMQRLFLWMGIVGAFAIMVSSIGFFHVSVDTTGLYRAEALRARLERVPLAAIDGAVMTIAMGIPLIITGVGGWMMELRSAGRSTRLILWASTVAWVLTIGAFVAALRIVSSGLARTGPGVEWPAELLTTLQWTAWIPMGVTLVFWGGIGGWIASDRSPMPAGAVALSPVSILLVLLALSGAASLVAPAIAPAMIAASPWLALALSFAALLAYRWRRPLP